MSMIRGPVSAGDASVQMEGELLTCSPQEWQRLLGAPAKESCKVIIPPDEALAMKAELGLPWNKLQIVRKYACIQLTCIRYNS